MSILIKSMEMPTNCDNCWALDDYGDYPRCRITEEQRGYNFPVREKRMKNCPLVTIPLHGKLIDADALKVALAFAEETAKWAVPALRAVLMVIDEMPTIIEASEEDE